MEVSSDRAPERRLRRSVFWKVAGVLVGALVLTGVGAVAVSAYLWEARSAELVRNSLALRLDAVAEEVEARAEFEATEDGIGSRAVLGEPLRRDLADRFPDPVGLLSPEGRLLEAPVDMEVPEGAVALIDQARTVVRLEDAPPWALVPLFDPDGVPAGALLVRPLQASIERELAGTREATHAALWIIAVFSLGAALLLGAALTARLVAPLRRMTAQVEAIGAGDFAVRLPADSRDEFGRLAGAINSMAGRVQASLDALRSTDRLRRELVANIGHDLRTPLAAMQGYLEEADRVLGEDRPVEAATALATARRQGRHVESLVRDLFELSLLDAAAAPAGPRPTLVREPVPLSELLHEAAATHRNAFASASISFDTTIPGDLPTIEADGGRLLRALDNLLDNARRYTPPGGEVRLDVQVSESSVTILVSDSGEGIAPELLKGVFERYYRGSTARTREHEGSGLGLAIARAIARAHGGDLTVTSAPGEGSTFSLSLPTDASGTA
jgi:signal transduction histidine kinase